MELRIDLSLLLYHPDTSVDTIADVENVPLGTVKRKISELIAQYGAKTRAGALVNALRLGDLALGDIRANDG